MESENTVVAGIADVEGGGLVEVSSARTVGYSNSRPSTRLGFRLVMVTESWPITRVGVGFRVICAEASAKAKKRRRRGMMTDLMRKAETSAVGRFPSKAVEFFSLSHH